MDNNNEEQKEGNEIENENIENENEEEAKNEEAKNEEFKNEEEELKEEENKNEENKQEDDMKIADNFIVNKVQNYEKIVDDQIVYNDDYIIKQKIWIKKNFPDFDMPELNKIHMNKTTYLPSSK